MISFESIISRRKALQKIFRWFSGAIFLNFFPSFPKSGYPMQHGSNVIIVRASSATDGTRGKDNRNLNHDVVRTMVDQGIRSFTGETDLKAAWSRIIPDPSRRVAIKINCQVKGIYTKSTVVKAITDGLILRGVKAENIVIYDKTDHAFEYAGFRKNLGPGIKVGTVDDFGGYHRFLHDRMAKLLTGGSLFDENKYRCDYLINVPVLKALDGYSGVTLSMKNHYGSIGNPGDHHQDIMAFLPYLNSRPQIREKTRLIVLDAIFVEYKWVNGRDQKYVDTLNQLIISDDPVAIDHTGWRIIEQKRKEHGLGPISPAPAFIQTAAKRGLGTTTPHQVYRSI